MTNGQVVLLSYAIIAVGVGVAFLTPLGLGLAGIGVLLRAYLLGHWHGWHAFSHDLREAELDLYEALGWERTTGEQ